MFKGNKMNKLKMLDKVSLSALKTRDKAILTELILRADDEGHSWPSVARLSKAAGIKNEKNFKGVAHYLPGLVRIEREQGQQNHYYLNGEAIMALPELEVEVKDTPARAAKEGNPPSHAGGSASEIKDNPPSHAGVTPLHAQGTPPFTRRVHPPSHEGTNNSKNNSLNNSENNSIEVESDDSPSNSFDITLEIEEWEEEKKAGPVETPPIPTEYEEALSLARKHLTYVSDGVWAHAEHLLYDPSYIPEVKNPHTRLARAIEAAELYAEHMGEWEAAV